MKRHLEDEFHYPEELEPTATNEEMREVQAKLEEEEMLIKRFSSEMSKMY